MTTKRTTVVSVRIVPELLDAVRSKAALDGRSVSGEIVSILRGQVASRQAERKSPKPLTGWLRHLDVPDTYAEFREGRRGASSRLLRGIVRPRRRLYPK